MFGDNKSVVDSASIPTSTLSKKTLASYHRVREAIAAGYLQFNWKDGKSNPSDITKRQATVETATYGSEFVAARIATDQIIDLRYTLMYLGVPVRSERYMFGDNKSVVDSASIPTSTLSKKSTLASYHRVREAIAAGYLQFNWKDGKSNPSDILSKHWEFANILATTETSTFLEGRYR